MITFGRFVWSEWRVDECDSLYEALAMAVSHYDLSGEDNMPVFSGYEIRADDIVLFDEDAVGSICYKAYGYHGNAWKDYLMMCIDERLQAQN